MRDHRAAIQIVQALAVRLLAVRLLAVRLLGALLQLHRDHLVRIVIVAAKIYRRAVFHQIALAQHAKFRKGVKPVIHAGFAPSRWNAINQDFAPEFSSQISLKKLLVKS
jgi:hypothetical protein